MGGNSLKDAEVQCGESKGRYWQRVKGYLGQMVYEMTSAFL